jgi:hypothetical protein
MAGKKAVLEYEALSGVQGLTVARRDNGRMTAIQLKDGSLCLYSPVKGLEGIEIPDGKVTHILAPNHYHNKGLVSFSAVYPRASICASKAASPRIKKLTGLTVKPLTSLTRKLPTGFDLMEPVGLKTGEVWVRFPVGRGVGWMVADSFSAKKMSATSNASTTSATPTLLGTFPSYAIADSATYVDWVAQMIERDKPQIVIPCHGQIIKGAGLPAKLSKLLGKLN